MCTAQVAPYGQQMTIIGHTCLPAHVQQHQQKPVQRRKILDVVLDLESQDDHVLLDRGKTLATTLVSHVTQGQMRKRQIGYGGRHSRFWMARSSSAPRNPRDGWNESYEVGLWVSLPPTCSLPFRAYLFTPPSGDKS